MQAKSFISHKFNELKWSEVEKNSLTITVFTRLLSVTPFVGLKQADFNLLQSLFLSGRDKEPEFHKYVCTDYSGRGRAHAW